MKIISRRPVFAQGFAAAGPTQTNTDSVKNNPTPAQMT
jgi:hypothetical protein